jgi:hypothetical protein
LHNPQENSRLKKCMLMAAVAYNMKKLMNYKDPKVFAMVKSIKQKQEKRIQIFVVPLSAAIEHYNHRFSLQN